MRLLLALASLTLLSSVASAQESVSLGSCFGCGLTAEGTVKCWAHDPSVTLGVGSSEVMVSEPTSLPW